ncbi:MAG: hypothetical protein AB3N64_14130 [Puniceicoccaceae bacterium]
MKFTISFAILFSFGALTAPQTVHSGPVVEGAIPSEVDWFVHVDMEMLRASKTGSAFHDEFKAIIPIPNKDELPIDPILIADGVTGITVFGTMPDFSQENFEPDAVVILEGTGDLLQVAKGLVSGMQIEQPEAIVPVEGDSNGILSIQGGQIYGSFVDENRLALSKTLPSLQNFFSTYNGTSAHINLSERFAIYSGDAASGIFFGAFVEGLNEFEGLPAQARILQLTEAVSLQLGEQGDYLNLLTSLMTADEKTAAQVSEVLKGLIAVFALSNPGNPEITTLVQSAKVSLNERTVSLNISYPVEAAVVWAQTLAQMAKAEMEAEKAAEEAEAAAEEAEAAAAEAEAEAEATADPETAG